MRFLWIACVAGLASAAAAQSSPDSLIALERRLSYRQGIIPIGDGIATLNVPPTFRYLSPAQTEEVIVAWGNPPGSTTLGMLVPANLSPLTAEGWGVVITYDEDGYVKDDDAATIDYDKMLVEMQKSSRAENKDRVKAGYPPVELVGWAEQPHYDQENHKLFWARELAFGTEANHTLNYGIRVLGRRGVLVLNAVAGMNQLDQVRRDMTKVREFAEFNTGHRYTDFSPGSDKVAEYGIAALVAGGIAAKAGLFKGLIALILAAKKLLVVAVVGVGAWLRKIFGGKKAAVTPAPATPSPPARR